MTIAYVSFVVFVALCFYAHAMWQYAVDVPSGTDFVLRCLLPWLGVLALGLAVLWAFAGGTLA